MNGISEGIYWNIHITQELEFSCGTFETNFSQNSYNVLIRKICDHPVCKSEFQRHTMLLHPGRLKVLNLLVTRLLCSMTATLF